MYFILMFVWHCTQERLTGAAVVGDEACALLFLCGAAAHYYYSSFFFFSILTIFFLGVRDREMVVGHRAL